ncbi:hypothetical protein DRW41_20395 [Neobacillus piezotolerans]|uniref:Uncharacterized protein n=1 Tax=Neobacillus piezotolerans TaxID=2259171 RepID=A0A3D8GL56_9BACI|nr:hypothetical protein [Neobacillus piezotolerans]RDU34979.1 hypothetical protein DRW41_20395 [Neobacillus piezotolerans]
MRIGTINWIVFLWQLSMAVAILTLFYGLLAKSRISLSVSFVTSLPIAYYFFGANNLLKLVALAPIAIIVAIIFLRKKRSRTADS